jgi:hypothetical protein
METYRSGNTLARGLSDQSSVTIARFTTEQHNARSSLLRVRKDLRENRLSEHVVLLAGGIRFMSTRRRISSLSQACGEGESFAAHASDAWLAAHHFRVHRDAVELLHVVMIAQVCHGV